MQENGTKSQLWAGKELLARGSDAQTAVLPLSRNPIHFPSKGHFHVSLHLTTTFFSETIAGSLLGRNRRSLLRAALPNPRPDLRPGGTAAADSG